MAYGVALPPDLVEVQDVFHVSTLRKYAHDLLHVVNYRLLQIQENQTYKKVPVQVFD